MNSKIGNRFLQNKQIHVHVILLAYAAISLFPIFIIMINSFKSRAGIFSDPLAIPSGEAFSLIGFQSVLRHSNFSLYMLNSLIVSLTSILLILVLGSMAAWALSEYSFKGKELMAIYLSIGIMIPVRLGTVSLIRIFNELGLINSLTALIIVYTAQGLPLCIFLLRQFFSQIPRKLKDVARVEGAREYRIYRLMLPLVRPVLATVSVFTMLPIWNDLWFPLILAPGESKKTIILGTRHFLGQFISDWNAVIAALFLSMIPTLITYIIFSRQLISGLTKGAIK